MKDPEFYHAQENWPQPPDDSCTLEPLEQVKRTAKKKNKAASAKAKRKMSESLAGVTAAAVAVVMLSTSIPALKDAFDDLPQLPDFTQPEYTMQSCPICERPDCPYFLYVNDQICYGIDISFADLAGEVTYSHGEDIYTLSGFITDDLLHVRHETIVTEKNERIVLVGSNTYDGLDGAWHWISQNKYMYDPVGIAYTGFLAEMTDEKSPGDTNFALINLVYDPSGAPQLIDLETISETRVLDVDISGAEYYTVDILDHPNIQLQFASDLGMEFLQELAGQFYVEYVKDVGLTYPLGQTMYLTETQQVYRGYDDYGLGFGGTIFNTGNTALDDQYFLHYSFCRKYYSFLGSSDATLTDIVFSQVSWNAVFSRWQELNAEAPDYGHAVYFPVAKLSDVTVNGIDYSAYAVYSTVDLQSFSDFCYLFECYFVPKQEDTVAVRLSTYLLKDDIKEFEESLQNDYVDIVKAFLQQITLR